MTTSTTFGPLFAERAVTIGREQLNFGFTFQGTSYDSFDGQSLDHSARACDSSASTTTAARRPGVRRQRPTSVRRSSATCCSARCRRDQDADHRFLRQLRRHPPLRCRPRRADRPRRHRRERGRRNPALGSGAPRRRTASTARSRTTFKTGEPSRRPALGTSCCARNTTLPHRRLQRLPERSICGSRPATRTICLAPGPTQTHLLFIGSGEYGRWSPHVNFGTRSPAGEASELAVSDDTPGTTLNNNAPIPA